MFPTRPRPIVLLIGGLGISIALVAFAFQTTERTVAGESSASTEPTKLTVAEIPDPLLRQSVEDMRKLVNEYKGSKDDKQVVEICMAARRVYCYFTRFEKKYGPSAVQEIVGIVQQLFKDTLQKLEWIKSVGDKNSDSWKSHESITEKYNYLKKRAAGLRDTHEFR